MSKFNNGDRVILKSGNLEMTILQIKHTTSGIYYVCQWYNKSNNSVRETFPEEALELAPEITKEDIFKCLTQQWII